LKKILTIGLLLFQSAIFSQSEFRNAINQIYLLTESERQAEVNKLITDVDKTGYPHIEGDTAYFIYQNNTLNEIVLSAGFNGWASLTQEKDYFTNITGTDFYFFAKKLELDARIEYKFVLDGSNYIEDPKNDNVVCGLFCNSFFVMPEYEYPWEMNAYDTVSQGATETFDIQCNTINRKYSTIVYKPYGYTTEERYPVVYFQDGKDYISQGKAITVLDNLIHTKRINPVIAVFVTPTNRPEEYWGPAKTDYVNSFANEIVPYIDNEYSTIQKKKSRCVIGDSDGAGVSACIAETYPNVFAKLGLQSIVAGIDNYFLQEPGNDTVEIFYQYGRYDNPAWYNGQEGYKDILINAGNVITIELHSDGHNFFFWGSILDNILTHFFKGKNASHNPTSSLKLKNKKISGLKAFPCPAINKVFIELPDNINATKIRIISLEGKTVDEKRFIQKNKVIELDISKYKQGVYFGQLQSKNEKFLFKIIK